MTGDAIVGLFILLMLCAGLLGGWSLLGPWWREPNITITNTLTNSPGPSQPTDDGALKLLVATSHAQMQVVMRAMEMVERVHERAALPPPAQASAYPVGTVFVDEAGLPFMVVNNQRVYLQRPAEPTSLPAPQTVLPAHTTPDRIAVQRRLTDSQRVLDALMSDDE